MVQDVVVGTLATLNTLVSPLGPAAPFAEQRYDFAIQANAMIKESCRSGKTTERSSLGMRLEPIDNNHFTAHIKIGLCTASFGYRELAQSVNLPSELLDSDFIARLKVDQPYVIRDIPSDKTQGVRNRLKITRLAAKGDLDPIMIEWIPNNGFESEQRPLTIWLAREKKALAGVHGFSKDSLPWKRVDFSYKHPLLGRPLGMTSNLFRIEPVGT